VLRPAAVVHRDEVLDAVRGALAIVLERDLGSLTPATSFASLNADSLSLVEFADLVEAEIASRSGAAVHIDDRSLADFTTVGDAVDYLIARL
jgi:acyl carrier protein